MRAVTNFTDTDVKQEYPLQADIPVFVFFLEMKGLSVELQDIIDFCEGRLSPDHFYTLVQKSDAEVLFDDAPSIPPYTQSRGMLHYYLIEQNYQKIEAVLNVQDCLTRFLEEKNIKIKPEKDTMELFDIVLKAQPPWLDLPSEYVASLLKGTENLDAGKKVSYLKNILKEKFKFMKKPPKWLQSPAWPIHDGIPLFFIGQLDVSELYHDKAQLYIFWDKAKERFHEVVQKM